MLTILSLIGTRPEGIKMAPVLRHLAAHSEQVHSVVCCTGQHREMLRPIFEVFDIRPDAELDVMQRDQTLAALTARLFDSVDPLVGRVQPDWILAQGDTTSVLAASLVAFYRGVRFGHVEAGLRTGDIQRPFPEELNRCVADKVSTLLFAPTDHSRRTLLAEGHPPERVVVTGNTVIDALHQVAAMDYDWSAGPLSRLPTGKRLVLITAHRRESFGEPFRELCLGLRELAERFESDGVHLVYPVHLNPNVRRPVQDLLAGATNISLLEPLDYLSLVHLMKRSSLILTDSGGIQEEAPGLNVPVLVMRDTTERPEGVDAGVVRLVGTSRQRIVEEASRLLTDENARAAMAKGVNPYGNGHAAERIVSALLNHSREI